MLTVEEKEYQSKLVNRLNRIADSLERISSSLDKLYLIMLSNNKYEEYADLEADFELSRDKQDYKQGHKVSVLIR